MNFLILYERLATIKSDILDFLFPLQERYRDILFLRPEDISTKASPANTPPISKTLSLFSYKDPIIHDLIWLIKYKNHKKAIRIAGELLYEYMVDLENDSLSLGNKKILIPMPCSRKRKKEKGFNQTEELCREVMNLGGKEFFVYLDNVLIKSKETPPQSHIKRRKERLDNPKESFGVIDKEKIKGKKIILFDDVITTGATLNEARRALKRAGAKDVFCITLAH